MIPKTITIQKITGGLGNQMFQYAYIKALSLRNGTQFSLDISEYTKYFRPYELEIFNIEKKYCKDIQIPLYEKLYSKNKFLNSFFIRFKNICKALNPYHIKEKKFHFDEDFLDIQRGYIEGYFQTEKYFQDFEKEIRNNFVFLVLPSKKNVLIGKEINSQNSISLHIRRGDYITNKKANVFHGMCDLNYYKKAIKYINGKVENPVYYIFSDDIDWVKDNLNIPEKTIYVDWNNNEKNFEDMRMMSLCKHNIIANSSFSWWGAWLNNNEGKIVIAPKKWFNSEKVNTRDIIPKTWIKI